MSSGINLLVNNEAEVEKEKRRVAIFNKIAFGALGFVCIPSLILFLLNIQLGRETLNKNLAAAENRMKAEDQKAAKLLILENRLTDAAAIIKKRQNSHLVLDLLSANMPQDAKIDSLSVEKKTVTLTVSSSSLLTINTVLNTLNSMAKDKRLIDTVTMNSLILNEQEGRYAVTLDATEL